MAWHGRYEAKMAMSGRSAGNVPELDNMGGCAREHYARCPGGRGTDYGIQGGVLRPCYDLGRAA